MGANRRPHCPLLRGNSSKAAVDKSINQRLSYATLFRSRGDLAEARLL